MTFVGPTQANERKGREIAMNYFRMMSLAVLSLVTFSSQSFATTSSTAKIQSVTFAGSGCPSNEAVAFTQQGDYLLISFASALKASVGPGITLSSLRKNCSATIVFAEDKKSLAIHSLGWYGLADLQEGQDANLNVSWFFQGQGTTGSFSSALKGPADDSWLNNFEAKVGQDLWEPCNAQRALTINTSLRISGPRDVAADSQLFILGVRFKNRAC